MKVKYHIPTEQYGFVEVEGEVEDIEDAIATYKLVTTRPYGDHVSGEGLHPAEFNKALDNYIKAGGNGAMTSECYEKMSIVQQKIIQELKKHFKRLKAKE